MKIYNILDEHNRLTKLPSFYFNGNGQYDSHTCSYLHARSILKSLDPVNFGLEAIIPELLNDDFRDPNEFIAKVNKWKQKEGIK